MPTASETEGQAETMKVICNGLEHGVEFGTNLWILYCFDPPVAMDWD